MEPLASEVTKGKVTEHLQVNLMNYLDNLVFRSIITPEKDRQNTVQDNKIRLSSTSLNVLLR